MKKNEFGKFIRDVAIILLLVAFTTVGYYVAQYLFNRSNTSSFGPELYYALDLAKTNTGYKDVIIGDSVARLIFAPDYQDETDTTCYLATNQAITVLGNYLLVSRYLDNNPDTRSITYIVRPQSLANPLWYNYSYQYFVVPFYNEEFMDLIDEDTRKYVDDRFGKTYASNALVKNFVINNNSFLDTYLNNVLEQQLEVRDEKHMSELAAKYLRELAKLCASKNVSFKVLAAPLPDVEINHDWSDFEKQISEYGLSDILGDYLEGIEFYDEAYFGDEAHFTKEYLEANRDEIIKKLFD